MKQGDADDSLGIRLASAPPPSRASQIQIVEPRTVPKLNNAGKKAAGGQWTVQVGTFNNRSDAREQLSIMEKKFGRHFDDARGAAQKDGASSRRASAA
jgi:D-alanyl-D-alanine carboxypeptidase (penicillin-binding protein 5/6)